MFEYHLFCWNWKLIVESIVDKDKINWNSIVGPWMVPKSVLKPINSSKNRLNSKIIYNFHPNPNAHLSHLVIQGRNVKIYHSNMKAT